MSVFTRKSIIWGMAALLVAVTFSSCAKKRDSHFQQGQGSDLELISAYQQKEFSLKTLGPKVLAQPLSKGNAKLVSGEQIDVKKGDAGAVTQTNVSRAEKLRVSADAHPRVNVIDLVEVETDAALLSKDIPFRGLPHQGEGIYRIRYQISPTYLKVLKIAKPQHVPMQELPYSETLADGRIAVPLVGYRLRGLYRVENQRSETDKDTHILLEIPETDLARATHFKVDLASREIFEAVRKVDVFPSDLFGSEEAKNNEWYMSVTVVNTQEGRMTSGSDESFVGAEVAIESAARIKMLKTPSGIRGVNLNVDPRVAKIDVLNLDPILMIPAEWKDYRAASVGIDKAMKEEVSEDRPWIQRDYMVVDFEKMAQTGQDVDQIDRKTGKKRPSSRGEKKLVDLEIAKNYIAYTLEESEKGVRTKFAFLRAEERNYQPKVAFFSDMKTFGFFTQIRNFIENYETHREEDYEKNQVIQRFNPNANAEKTIYFHFTANSPKQFRSVGEVAVAEWNRAFAEAGTGVKVVLGKEDVALGDLRYNKINLIETVSDGTGLLGYGPSIADPRTGEIISATANIYVNPVRSGIIESIRRYVLEKTNALAGKEIDLSELGIAAGKASPIMPTPPQKNPQDKDNGEDKLKSVLAATNSDASVEPITGHEPMCSVGIIGNRVYRDIEENCDKEGKLSGYIAKVRASGKLAVEGEIALLQDCASRLIVRQMVPTLLHEMGHNFGLRHNFRGSYDAKNFGSKERHSSSIMEYSADEDDDAMSVGPYDIAAIRFGYADAVETTTADQFIRLDPNRSIADNLAEKGRRAREYQFCTDENTGINKGSGANLDPFCRRFDSGTTALEVVNFHIRQFAESYKFGYSRLGRFLRWGNRWEKYEGQLPELFALKEIYDFWRVRLTRAMRAQGLDPYFNGYSAQNFEDALKKIESRDPTFAEFVKEYRPAADQIFRFLKKTAFLPNNYCVFSRDDKKGAAPAMDAIEFDTLADLVASNHGVNISSCTAPEVSEWAEDRGLNYVTQVGFPLTTGRFIRIPTSKDTQVFGGEVASIPDYIGTKEDRDSAMFMLTVRNERSKSNEANKSYPSMMDEPAYRAEIQNELMARVTEGVDLSEFKIPGLARVPRFEKEKELLFIQFQYFLSGLKNARGTGEPEAYVPFQTVALDVGTQEYNNKREKISLNGIGYGPVSDLPNGAEGAKIRDLVRRSKALSAMRTDEVAFMQEAFAEALLHAKNGESTVEKVEDSLQLVGYFLNKWGSAKLLAPAIQAEPNLDAVINLFNAVNKLVQDAPDEEKPKVRAAKIAEVANGALKLPDNFQLDLEKAVPAWLAQARSAYQSYKDNQIDADAQIDLIKQVIKASHKARAEGG